MTTGQTDGSPPEADASAEDGRAAPTEAELEAEIASLRQQHLRAVADYQNLRRRSEEERREYARYTLSALVINYLPVLDDLDRAGTDVPAGVETWERLVKFAGENGSEGVTWRKSA